MEYSMNQQQKSMMQSVSKNIKGFQLDPIALHSSPHGEIFQLTHPHRQQTLVLKVIFRKQKNNYKEEKEIHQLLKNRYIVRLENAFKDQTCFYLVMEHCKKGNLKSILNSKKLAMETVKQYSLQIAKGIQYLHKNKIVHHGINPTNILLTSQNQIKICDFGLATHFQEGKTIKGCQNNLAYTPPEGIENHNEKFDVWSLGCLIYQMATGNLPFSFKSWKQHAATLTKHFLQNYSFDTFLPFYLINLLKKIFTLDKEERISIDQLINHSFFTGEPLPQQKKHGKSQQRPLAVKKKRSKTSMKSVESKGSQQNKENTDHANRVVSKRPMPNYKEILQKKFKKTEGLQKRRVLSKEGCLKTAIQGFKESKQFKQAVQSATLSRKSELSPLNTLNMKIAPLRLKSYEIRIDRDGFTRQSLNKEFVQFINISCDGQLIKMKKGKREKLFAFEALPQEYYNQYQECKRLLEQIKAQEPQIVFTNRNFLPELALQMKINYNKTISISLEQQLDIKNIAPQQFLANIKNIKAEYFNPLRHLYLRLIELHQM